MALKFTVNMMQPEKDIIMELINRENNTDRQADDFHFSEPMTGTHPDRNTDIRLVRKTNEVEQGARLFHYDRINLDDLIETNRLEVPEELLIDLLAVNISGLTQEKLKDVLKSQYKVIFHNVTIKKEKIKDTPSDVAASFKLIANRKSLLFTGVAIIHVLKSKKTINSSFPDNILDGLVGDYEKPEQPDETGRKDLFKEVENKFLNGFKAEREVLNPIIKEEPLTELQPPTENTEE